MAKVHGQSVFSLPVRPVVVLRRRHHREVKDRLVHATDADAHVRHAGRTEDDARLGQKVLLAIERDHDLAVEVVGVIRMR